MTTLCRLLLDSRHYARDANELFMLHRVQFGSSELRWSNLHLSYGGLATLGFWGQSPRQLSQDTPQTCTKSPS